MGTMIKKLSNFFRIKNPSLEPTDMYHYDSELVAKLESIGYGGDIQSLLKDPVVRIFVINVYSIDFGELGSLLINKRYERKIRAVSLSVYFKGNEGRVTSAFLKIAQLVKEQKCTTEGLHDINELIDTINQLKTLKGIPL